MLLWYLNHTPGSGDPHGHVSNYLTLHLSVSQISFFCNTCVSCCKLKGFGLRETFYMTSKATLTQNVFA